MKISYKKLWILFIEREIKPPTLRNETGISTSTMHKLNKGEEISLAVLLKICKYLKCNIGYIYDAIPIISDIK